MGRGDDGRRVGGLGRRLGGSLLATLLTLAALVQGGSVTEVVAQAQDWAPPTKVYISATGHTLDGYFLDAWRATPELFGNPITEEFKQTVDLDQRTDGTAGPGEERIVQYFEHVALVYLPERDPGDQVQFLPLGRMMAKAVDGVNRYDEAFEPATCDGASAATCQEFPETGHTIRSSFKRFWDSTAWAERLGAPVSEAYTARNGQRIQYFEFGGLHRAVGEEISVRPVGKEIARRMDLNTRPIARADGIPVFDELLFSPPPAPIEPEPVVEEIVSPFDGVGPGPQQGGYKEVVVSISSQAVWAYEGGQLMQFSYVSTGTGEVPETVTPIGYHQILSKYDVQTMEGTISNEYYLVPDVPNVMYFDNLGNALHGAYWHNNFGTPMSHGCINLPLDVAAWMYAWAPVGTAVTVIA